MKIVFHSLTFLLISGRLALEGVPMLLSGPFDHGTPGLAAGGSPRLPLQPVPYGQPGQFALSGQPRFPGHFEHKEQFGPFDQSQIGIAVQPGVSFNSPRQPGQAQFALPGAPRLTSQFEAAQTNFEPQFGQPAAFRQNQIGVAVQPGAYSLPGQTQIPVTVQMEAYGPPGQEQPRFSNQFQAPLPVQPGFGQPRFSNQQFGASFPAQPGFSSQGQPGQLVSAAQPGFKSQFDPSGQPGMDESRVNLFTPEKPLLDEVNAQLQQYQQLNNEISKRVMELMQNKSAQVPPNVLQQPQPNPTLRFHQEMNGQNVPAVQNQFSVQPNAWTPYPQNQWSNRFLRSPHASLQALQAQGYQIVKLQDYKNFEERPISGPMGSFSEFAARSYEQTPDQKSYGSALAQNSTLNTSKGSQNIQIPNLRAASSSDDFVVGSPLQLCKSFESDEQHHPIEEREKLKAYCSNVSPEEKSKNAEFNASTPALGEIPSTFHSKNSTVGKFLRQATDSVGNSTQPEQLLSSSQNLQARINGPHKRFGDDYIGLSEELVRNSTMPARTPARYLYRAAVNGNPPQLIPLPATARSLSTPISTPNTYNYYPYASPTAGHPFYQPPNSWPRYAAYNNNNYQLSLINSAPGNPIAPTANNFPKIPLYRAPNYFY